MKNTLLSLTVALIFMASPIANAFEVTGESFPAEFEVTSLTSTPAGSVLTAEGDIADYGRVFLTYNLEERPRTIRSWTFFRSNKGSH